MPQTKEEKSEYQRQWYIKNRERLLQKSKEYAETHKEEKKLYDLKNKEKQTKQMYDYNRTPSGKKSMKISDWKFHGLIGDYDEIYDRYINCNNCEECNCEFSIIGDGVGRFKCMDHDHITGLFRNVLCNTCNLRRG